MPASNPITDLATTDGKLDLFASFLESGDEGLAVAQVPALFGTSDMATYLGYRSMGLTSQQALLIMEADEDVLEYWQEKHPEFLEFERKQLPLLQRHTAKEIARLGFTRNLMLFLAKDQQVITKFNIMGPDGLSNREFAYIRSIRRHYTNQDLLAIEKVINPDEYKGDTVIQLNWGPNIQTIEGVEASYEQLSPSSD